MNPTDAHLVAVFLKRNFDRFIDYLDECAITPAEVEASMIIDAIAAESGGRMRTNLEQLVNDRSDDFLAIEEEYIWEVIRAAQANRDSPWLLGVDTKSGLEEIQHTIRERVAEIEKVSMASPHWRIELMKVLLQTAAICVSLMAKTMSGRLTHDGIHPTTSCNLSQFDRPIAGRFIAEVIRAARTIQEFLWSDMNTGSGLEEFRRMFRKRLAKIEAISMDNPHWRIELLKRLLQTAAICVNLMTKAVSGRLTHDGIHPTLPSNLPKYGQPIENEYRSQS